MAAQPPDQPHDGAHDEQPDAVDEPPSVDELAGQLPPVVLDGVDSSTPDVLRGLFRLERVQERASDASDDALARAARDVIHQALDALGSGPYGQAARLLFGSNDDSRGQPRHVRRRLAADQVHVMPRWFARSHERQIIRDVAAAIFDLEHPPAGDQPAAPPGDASTAVVRVPDGHDAATDTETAIAPAQQNGAPAQTDDGQTDDGQAGDGQADGAEVTRSRVRRVLGWVRPRVPDEQALTVVMAGRSSAPALTASQPKQLLHDLEQLRDQRARRQWYGVFVLAGFVVVWRYGFDALPRYVLVLAILGVGKTATDMFQEWRATRTARLHDRWPRIVMLIMTVGLAGGFVIEQRDDGAQASGAEAARRGECVLGVVPREGRLPRRLSNPRS